jgi:hypothetical protein
MDVCGRYSVLQAIDQAGGVRQDYRCALVPPRSDPNDAAFSREPEPEELLLWSVVLQVEHLKPPTRILKLIAVRNMEVLELLQKAQVFSLNLREIANRTGLGISEGTLPDWKVEMAIEAARKFLRDIFAAMDQIKLVPESEIEALRWDRLLNLETLRSAIPVSIGLALRVGRNMEALKDEFKKIKEKWVGRERRVARERALENFLSEFRELAKQVVDKGGYSLVSWGDVESEVRESLSRHFPSGSPTAADFFVSEHLRDHVITVLTDILRLIVYTPEEVREEINEGYKSLGETPHYSLFNTSIMRLKGFKKDEQIELVQDFLAPAVAIQYYLNRISSTRAHSIFPPLVSVLQSDIEFQPSFRSYFPVIQWLALRPHKRTPESLRGLSDRSLYQFIVDRGAVTAYGEDPLNVQTSTGHNRVAMIAQLMGEQLPASISRSVAQASARRFPLVMGAFADSLIESLTFLWKHWEEISKKLGLQQAPASEEGQAPVSGNIQTPVLRKVVQSLGLDRPGVDAREKIGDVILKLRRIKGQYAPSSPDLVENVLYYITSLSEALEWALGTSEEEILKNIHLLASELVLYFASDTESRSSLLRPFASQAFYGPAGSHMTVRYGLSRGTPVVKISRHDPLGQIINAFISDLVDYILRGPSAEENPEVWRQRVVGGLNLAILGEKAQSGDTKFWREKYENVVVDWDSVAQFVKNEGPFLRIKMKDWTSRVLPTLEDLESQKLHETLLSYVFDSWKSLSETITGRILSDVGEVLEQDPSALVRYLRAARVVARSFRREEVSLDEPLRGVEGGLTYADVVVGEERVKSRMFYEEVAEKVVDGLAAEIIRSLGEVEEVPPDVKPEELLEEAFKAGRSESIIEAFERYLLEVDEEARRHVLGALNKILNEVAAGLKKVEGLPLEIEPSIFAEFLRSKLTGTPIIREISEEEIGEIEIGEGEEEWEEGWEEGEEEEGEAEDELEEERLLMKFYLLSKVLPIYSS